MGKYREIDHDADVGLEVSGSDLADLFRAAACGMFFLIFGARGEGRPAEETYTVEIVAPTAEDLLVEFLSELLYRYESEGLIASRVSIDQLTADALRARVSARRNVREKPLLEIKSVTHHNLKIEPATRGVKATVIFDV